MKQIIKHNKKSGFTIIETLVSLSIFSISIIALVVVSARGISDSSVAKNRLTATYLAQEGLELMRNKRDTAIIQGSANGTNGWTNFQSSTTDCAPSGGCDIDPLSEAIYKCNTGTTVCTIKSDTSTGYYGHPPYGVDTIFKRVITLEEPTNWGSNPDEYQMTVTVSWTQGISPQSVKLVENIYNWQ